MNFSPVDLFATNGKTSLTGNFFADNKETVTIMTFRLRQNNVIYVKKKICKLKSYIPAFHNCKHFELNNCFNCTKLILFKYDKNNNKMLKVYAANKKKILNVKPVVGIFT